MHKASIIKKKSSIAIVLAVTLSACNGGSNNSPGNAKEVTESDKLNPPLHNLVMPMRTVKKNVFDSDSIKNLIFTIKKLDDTNLDIIDLSKIGGYASYKLLINNPNGFSLQVHNLHFGNSNYYFTKNSSSDNCFNQEWYHGDQKNGSQLNMPAKTSCALYTTSAWLENLNNDQLEQIDYISYTAEGESFGYTVANNTRKDMWCQANCSPIGKRDNYTLKAKGNDIHFKFTPLKPSVDSTINNSPSQAFILSGNYLISGAVESSILNFKKYSLQFDPNQSTIKITDTADIPVTGAMALKGFAIARDGLTGVANVDYFGSPGIQNLALTFSLDQPFHSEPQETFFPQGIQGADGHLYCTAKYYPGYKDAFIRDSQLGLTPLRRIIEGLPRTGNIALAGVDAQSNLVFLTDDNKNGICYRSDSHDWKVSQFNLTGIADNPIISNKYLYTAAAKKAYYSFDQVERATPFYSQVDTKNCSINNLMLATPDKLIITDKFTAIKTSQGYAFVNPDQVSDGSNNIK